MTNNTITTPSATNEARRLVFSRLELRLLFSATARHVQGVRISGNYGEPAG